MAWTEPKGAVPIVVTGGDGSALATTGEARITVTIAWYDTPGTCVSRVSTATSPASTQAGPGGAALAAQSVMTAGIRGSRPWQSDEDQEAPTAPTWPWAQERDDILVPGAWVVDPEESDEPADEDDGTRLLMYLPDLFEVAKRVTTSAEGEVAAGALSTETGLDLTESTANFYASWTGTLTSMGGVFAAASGIETAHTALPYSYVHWLQSDEALDFTLDLGTDWLEATPQATAIPTRKAPAFAWTYPVMPSGGLNGGATPVFSSAFFVAEYAHPSVVELPDGWLMILGRVRVPHEDSQEEEVDSVSSHKSAMALSRAYYDTGTELVSVPVGVHNSLSDVVGYWSPDPTFRTGVRGPFLLVHCLEALPGQTTRVGLGVPSGRVATTWTGPRDAFWSVGSSRVLYLYYTVNVAKPTTGDGASLPPGSFPSELDPLLDSISEEQYELDAEEYRSNGSSTLATRRTPMALKVIAIDDLMQVVDNWQPYASTDPGFTQSSEVEMDTQVPATDQDPATSLHVPGELMGIVRFWIPLSDGSTSYEALEDHLEERIDGFPQANGSNGGVRFVDPEPAWCAAEATMALTFCCRRQKEGNQPGDLGLIQPGTGYGIWRALPMPAGHAIAVDQSDGTGSLRLTSEGVDLLVSTFEDDGSNPNLAMVSDLSVLQGLAASGEVQGHYADPTVAQLPGGSWRLYASGLESGGGVTEQPGRTALDVVEGSHEDCCGV